MRLLVSPGTEIRIDAAVEDQRDSPAEVRLPLSTAQAGQPRCVEQYIQIHTGLICLDRTITIRNATMPWKLLHRSLAFGPGTCWWWCWR